MQAPELSDNPTKVCSKSLLRMRGYTRYINLKSLKKTTSFISGLHDSKFSGRGMDYQESRIYQAGDDIRNMDWRVTARTGNAHTKLYQEERERPVYVIIDTNQSMRFGTRQQFKSVLAAKIAALFAWTTTKNGDRIGVMSFGINGIHSRKPRAGQKGAMAVISHLLENSPDQVDNNTIPQFLDDCLQQLRSVIRPGSLVIIISDFYHTGNDCRRHLAQLTKHNDVIGILVNDPFETHPPLPSLYGVVTEGGRQLVDTRKKKISTQINNERQQHLQMLIEQVIKSGVSLIPIATDDDLVGRLKRGLEQPSLLLKNWMETLR